MACRKPCEDRPYCKICKDQDSCTEIRKIHEVKHSKQCQDGAYCEICTDQEKCTGFRKLQEIKDRLTIYSYTDGNLKKKKLQVPSNFHPLPHEIEDLGENVYIIVCNNNDKDQNVEECLEKMDERDVSCPTCRNFMTRAKDLLKNVSVVEKKGIKAICDECTLQQGSLPCTHCRGAINKFKTDNLLKVRTSHSEGTSKTSLHKKKKKKGKSQTSRELNQSSRDKLNADADEKASMEEDLQIIDLEKQMELESLEKLKKEGESQLDISNKEYEDELQRNKSLDDELLRKRSKELEDDLSQGTAETGKELMDSGSRELKALISTTTLESKLLKDTKETSEEPIGIGKEPKEEVSQTGKGKNIKEIKLLTTKGKKIKGKTSTTKGKDSDEKITLSEKGKEGEGKRTKGTGTERKGTEGKRPEGKGTERKGTEGKGTEGKGTEGKETEGKGTEGKDTEEKETEGKETMRENELELSEKKLKLEGSTFSTTTASEWLKGTLTDKDIRDVSCPRCQHLMKQTMNLLKKVENKGIKAICDLCTQQKGLSPCEHCQRAIKKFKTETLIKEHITFPRSDKLLKTTARKTSSPIGFKKLEKIIEERNTIKISGVSSESETVKILHKLTLKPTEKSHATEQLKSYDRSITDPDYPSLKSATAFGLGTTGIVRKFHSEESFITSLTDIANKKLSKTFEYYFPSKKETKRKIGKETSRELIKSTQVKFRAEAKEKERLENELKKNKTEKQMKRKLEREQHDKITKEREYQQVKKLDVTDSEADRSKKKETIEKISKKGERAESKTKKETIEKKSKKRERVESKTKYREDEREKDRREKSDKVKVEKDKRTSQDEEGKKGKKKKEKNVKFAGEKKGAGKRILKDTIKGELSKSDEKLKTTAKTEEEPEDSEEVADESNESESTSNLLEETPETVKKSAKLTKTKKKALDTSKSIEKPGENGDEDTATLLNEILRQQEKEKKVKNKAKKQTHKLRAKKKKIIDWSKVIKPKRKDEKDGDKEEPKLEDKKKKKKEPKEMAMKDVKMIESADDLILKLVKMHRKPDQKRTPPPVPLKSPIPIKRIIRKKPSVCSFRSELELDAESLLRRKAQKLEIPKIIYGEKIISMKDVPVKVEPFLIQANVTQEILDQNKENISKTTHQSSITQKTSGPFRYSLSNPRFIDNGWTILPIEKNVRKINIYRMSPANPNYDWFKLNKAKLPMWYDNNEKMADVSRDDGCGRWYYRNGKVALEYHKSKEIHSQQRIVVYSSGCPSKRETLPITVLAVFDFNGNGIVFDHHGKIRLKYNQNEGVLLDRDLGPASHWLWHFLNEPPDLHKVITDTQLKYKDPKISALSKNDDNKKIRIDHEDMINIELDNFVKAQKSSSNSNKEFKPYQIRMKALKINEQFSLKILSQNKIYLFFRDGQNFMKFNLGMELDHNVIIDTAMTEVDEVSISMQKQPALSNSIENLQKILYKSARLNRVRDERDLQLRPRSPAESVNEMTAVAAKPLRLPPLADAGFGHTSKAILIESPTNSSFSNYRLI